MKEELDNRQHDINALSFEKLLSLSNILREGVRYGKYCCLKEVATDTDRDIFKFPVKIDAYILVICSDGLIELSCDLYNLTLSSKSMFLYNPNTILRLNALGPSRLSIMVFTQEFIDELGVKPGDFPLQYGCFGEQRAYRLTEQTCNIMRGITRLGENFIGLNNQNPCYHELIRSALKSFLLRAMYEINEQCGCSNGFELLPAHENNNFKKFMRLLQENCATQHNIHFYADKMNLSPKYLSLMIKKVSGKLATEWIEEYVILEAKNLIKYSSMSIQEIAYALNFPNQSFFSKVFKRNTGVSPKAYRLQL